MNELTAFKNSLSGVGKDEIGYITWDSWCKLMILEDTINKGDK